MNKKKIAITLIISAVILFISFIPLQTIYASTVEEEMNNLTGPRQQYNTMLSPAYLRNNTSEDSVSPQSGSISLAQTDYVLPGISGLDVEIKRIYSSGSANVREMKAQYINGVWVDQVYSDNTTSSFYEDRYNLGIGMRFSFPTIEIKKNEDSTSCKYLHTEAGDVYELGKPKEEKEVITYPIENQTVKDVTISESKEFTNGQSTSFYVMTTKEGKKTFFDSDGRILGIVDRYSNKITFQYIEQEYKIDGTVRKKKLLSKITDTLGREINIEYKEDASFVVGPIQNEKYSLEDSYKASQNPDNTNSGDLKGKFQVIITLPGNKQIIYDKSAVLVNTSKHVVRTRLQRVFDLDGKPKYHFWYDQPELGFTFRNGKSYSAYNRYETLTQLDYCKTNRLERFSYDTYTKSLSNMGSMQYRKVFEKKELEKTGFDSSKSKFLDSFNFNIRDRITYKYSNEPDGYDITGYNDEDKLYLKDTYRYYTEKAEYNNAVTKYTYNGIHEIVDTVEKGSGHTRKSHTEYDERKFPKKTETTFTNLENGQQKGKTVKKIENFRYDEYGNLANYIGPLAERDENGYPVNEENTVTYTYDYNKYHMLTSKTWYLDKNTKCQIIYTVDNNGDVIKEKKVHTSDSNSWIVTDYSYDTKGNMLQKTVHDKGHNYVTKYEYGTDADGVNHKGAYLTKQFSITDDNVEISSQYTYDFNTGNKLAELDENGNRTSYTYDTLSRIVKITYPDSTTKQYTYNDYVSRNKEIQYTDPSGVNFLYKYDIFGNQVEYDVNDNEQWHVLLKDEYNSQGNKVKEIDANGNSTRFTYNSENLILKKEYFEKDSVKKEDITLEYTYGPDAESFLLISLTDEDGYTKKMFFDVMNRQVKSEVTPDKSRYYISSIQYNNVGNKVSETDARGNSTRYTYDDNGRLVSKKDALNNETKYTYNSIDKLLYVDEPKGRTTSYLYDTMGRTVQERIYDRAVPDSYVYKNYSYDKAGNVTALEQGSFDSDKALVSSYSEYSYNNMNRLTDQYSKIDDTRKSHTKFTYDKKGNKINIVDYISEDGSSNLKQSFEYDYGDRVIKEEGIMTRQATEINPAQLGHYIKKFGFDYAGNLICQEQYNGVDYDKTSYAYDYRNRLVQKEEPFTSDGKVKATSYSYDRRGNLTTETVTCSGTDYTTQYQYNGLGKASVIIDPMGGVTKYLYDENGNLTKEIDPRYSSVNVTNAPGIEYQYDALNRQVGSVVRNNSENIVTSYREYDSRGNVTKEADGEGYNKDNPSDSFGNIYEYDALNNITKYISAQTYKDNTINGTSNFTRKYTYDGSGRQLAETDALGNVTQSLYFMNGLLKEKIYPDKSKESHEFDLTGKTMSVDTDKEGNKTTVYLNIFGKPYRIEYPDTTVEIMEYSNKGEMIKSIDKAGDADYFSYNLLGNLIDKKEFLTTDGTFDSYKHIRSSYNELGKPISVETFLYTVQKGTVSGGEDRASGDKINITYDKNSRLVKESGPAEHETLNEYDKKGNLITKKKKIDNDNYLTTRYKYDVQSRCIEEALLADTSELDANSIRKVEFDNEYTTKVKSKTTYTYFNNGQVKSKTDGNEYARTYQYDLDKRVVKETAKYSTDYSYDLNGNVREKKNAKGISTYYEYDNMGRLLRKKAPSAGNEMAVTRYIYDIKGNLTKKIDPNNYDKEKDTPQLASSMKGMSYTYDNMNRRLLTILPDGSVQEYLKYDAMGNIIKRVDGLRFKDNIENSFGLSYEYDSIGRLLKETNPLGYFKTYEYNVLGGIVKATDENGNSTLYDYNGDGTLAKQTFADGGSIEYSYDKLGRKISEKNQLGSITKYSYNSFGKIKTEIDVYGNALEYKADLAGNIISSKDKKGSITYITYDFDNRVIKKRIPIETDGSGNIIYSIENYTYDELGNIITAVLTGTKDKLSTRTKTYTYYDNGLMNTVIDSGEAFSRSYYDKNGNTIKKEILRSEGIYDIEKFEYDSLNRLIRDIKLIDEEDIYNTSDFEAADNLRDDEYPGKFRIITQYEYDILGNKTKEIRPMAFAFSEDDSRRDSYITNYSYDILNRLETVTKNYDGKDVTLQYTYDKAGNKLSEKNERGFETKYTFDNLNRVQTITDPENNTLKYTYDLVGNKLSETNSKGCTMTYGYDKLNRLATTTDAYGKIIGRKVYDANSNVIKEIDAKGYLSGGDDETRYGTVHTYDMGNRLVKTASPEATAQNTYSMEYSYNQYGEVTGKKDALGNVTAYQYDNRGKLTKVTDPMGVSTKYSYDKQGSKLTMTDGRGKLTDYRYTAFGNTKTILNPDGKTASYKYDLSGNAVCITDKNGNNTLYFYDSRGLVLEKKVKETGDSIKYTYDEVGNRKSMEDESGVSVYTYDGNNRLLEIKKDGASHIGYAYDEVGNVAKVTDKKGNIVSYTYDKSNRMETVTANGETTTYTYDENGNRDKIEYEGGVSEEYTYDRDNHLILLENKKPDGTIISEYNYKYDLAGRQISKTDSYGTTSYEYDRDGRVIKIAAPGKTTLYTYDNAGNRVSQNETYTSAQPSSYIDSATGKEIQYILKKSEYTYSSSNQLLKLSERMFDESNKEIARKTTKTAYDDNGNQLKQSVSYTLPADTKLLPTTKGNAYGDSMSGTIDKLVEKTSYTFDGFNRLKKAETVKDGKHTEAEYKYDGDDLRVNKTVKKSDNAYKEEITNYLYDRQNVILETDAAGNIKTRYIKGINYIASLDSENKETYFLFNGHGDTVQTVNEAGEVQNRYDYDIWGNPTLTIEVKANAIRYAGEYIDTETGLYYLRARYYDPYVGRFISEDSYFGEDENPLSLNRYTYCHNDPIQFVDPSGHSESIDKFLSVGDQERVQKLGQDYAAAKKKGNIKAMDDAHRAAAAIRASVFGDKYVDTYKYRTPEPDQNPNGCYGIGSRGEKVEDIQTALVNNGYSVGNSGPNYDGIDKTFGVDTKAAVVRYQIDNGLSYDGIVGKNTAKSLGVNLENGNAKKSSKGNGGSSRQNDEIMLYHKTGEVIELPSNSTLITYYTNNGWSYSPPKTKANNSNTQQNRTITLYNKDGTSEQVINNSTVLPNYINNGWSYSPPKKEVKKEAGNDVNISLDVNTGTIVVKNGNSTTTMSLPSELYDASKDSGLANSSKSVLAKATIEWYNADNQAEKDAILSGIKAVRQYISEHKVSEWTEKYLADVINDNIGGLIGIFTDALTGLTEVEQLNKQIYYTKSAYIMCSVVSVSSNALNMGNKVHYDQLNGGTGEWLPTELQKMYKDTEFSFPRRGQRGADVEYVSGMHPSKYKLNPMKWPEGFNYGDFKPGTANGYKTFLKDINKGKLPADSVYLPYEPKTGKLKVPKTK